MFANNSQDAKIRVGLEIEKPTCVDGETNIKMKKKQWRCETDSSAGYEYITPILSIDNIEECIDWVTTT